MTRLMCIGAHPDDPELMAGGLAALLTGAGGPVCFVSVTNGEAGHYEMHGAVLARRRRMEAESAALLIDAEAVVLENPDAQLIPTLEVRHQIVRLIRLWQPDLVITHRPNDYHPDHRYTGQLVQDSTYLLTVPNVLSDVTALASDPVVMYGSDSFRRPYPFQADIVIDIDAVLEKKLDLLDRHESQYYEWLPFHDGKLSEVPLDHEGRRAWLRRDNEAALRADANRFRDQLVARYGPERGAQVVYAEAYELCEYGRQIESGEAATLLPF
jgi:LmbE family N-acetylglucosaminyl deacetylase